LTLPSHAAALCLNWSPAGAERGGEEMGAADPEDMRLKSLLLGVALLGVCLPPTALAETTARSASTIRVTGNAMVAARPDRAEIDIGVMTQSQDASAAAANNAAHLQAVLTQLRKVLGERADIKTVSYTLTPNYRVEPGGAEPILTGYAANNIVRVTLDDLGKAGAVIDAATRSGANRVQDIRFTLREPETVRLQALREAATQAKAEADALASALGLKVLRVLSVEEAGGLVRPIRPMPFATARAEAAAVVTPVEAGSLEVSATVTLTMEVGP
jgi:uncharacterized protein YggE